MKLWFRAKRYGWGWYPTSVEGWAFLLIFVIVFSLNAVRFSLLGSDPTTSDTIIFLIQNIVLVTILLVVCCKKGEKPEWRWAGKPICKSKQ